MEYSETINRLRQDYRLQPQDVMFAILCASGCSRAESYAHIYRPSSSTESTIKNGAARLVKQKPSIIKLIQDLQDKNKIPVTAELPSQRRQKQIEQEKLNSGWNPNESPEENVKRIMVNEMWKLDAKEKIQESRNLAKLMGVSVEQRELTHYYIPISCKQCSLYVDAEKKRKKEQQEQNK